MKISKSIVQEKLNIKSLLILDKEVEGVVPMIAVVESPLGLNLVPFCAKEFEKSVDQNYLLDLFELGYLETPSPTLSELLKVNAGASSQQVMYGEVESALSPKGNWYDISERLETKVVNGISSEAPKDVEPVSFKDVVEKISGKTVEEFDSDLYFNLNKEDVEVFLNREPSLGALVTYRFDSGKLVMFSEDHAASSLDNGKLRQIKGPKDHYNIISKDTISEEDLKDFDKDIFIKVENAFDIDFDLVDGGLSGFIEEAFENAEESDKLSIKDLI